MRPQVAVGMRYIDQLEVARSYTPGSILQGLRMGRAMNLLSYLRRVICLRLCCQISVSAGNLELPGVQNDCALSGFLYEMAG